MSTQPEKIELYETEGEMHHLRVDDKVAHILGTLRRSAKGHRETLRKRFDRLAERLREDEFASLEDPIFIGEHKVEPLEEWHRREFYAEDGMYAMPKNHPRLVYVADTPSSVGN